MESRKIPPFPWKIWFPIQMSLIKVSSELAMAAVTQFVFTSLYVVKQQVDNAVICDCIFISHTMLL